MPTTHLSNRALIDVTGPEAEHFLQNVLTPDLTSLERNEAKPGALLTPQGKILFAFLISRGGADAFVLEARAEDAHDLVKRLMLYRLRTKADISMRKQDVVAVSWGDKPNTSHPDAGVIDLSFPSNAGVMRQYGALTEADARRAEWDRLRIAHGVVELGADFEPSESFPHDVLFDQNGGVGLKKGCFVGQEVVSRMQHRGTARRRVMIVKGEAALPARGAEITAGGRTLGTLGSIDGADGLAIVRIDRVKDALDVGEPIRAVDVPVTLSIPAWASYTLPERAAGAEET